VGVPEGVAAGGGVWSTAVDPGVPLGPGLLATCSVFHGPHVRIATARMNATAITANVRKLIRMRFSTLDRLPAGTIPSDGAVSVTGWTISGLAVLGGHRCGLGVRDLAGTISSLAILHLCVSPRHMMTTFGLSPALRSFFLKARSGSTHRSIL